MPGGVGRWAGRLQAQAVLRLALAWLLLALVVVPTLGRLHHVAHGGALDRVHAGRALAHSAALASSLPLASAATASGTANAAPLPAASHGHGLWSLFLGQHAPVDCLLLDQLALGDALHSAPAALPEVVPTHRLPTMHCAPPLRMSRCSRRAARLRLERHHAPGLFGVWPIQRLSLVA